MRYLIIESQQEDSENPCSGILIMPLEDNFEERYPCIKGLPDTIRTVQYFGPTGYLTDIETLEKIIEDYFHDHGNFYLYIMNELEDQGMIVIGDELGKDIINRDYPQVQVFVNLTFPFDDTNRCHYSFTYNTSYLYRSMLMGSVSVYEYRELDIPAIAGT